MTAFTAKDPDFGERIRVMFSRQPFMVAIGARVSHVAPGETDIVLPHRADLLQQHGYFHGGVTASIADNAAGCASTSLFDIDSGPLTSEFKICLLAPARGDKLIARGRVIKPGRTLTVARADVFGISGDAEIHVATALVTIMRLEGLSDLLDDAGAQRTRRP